jgi:hypothetical protein
MPLKIYTLEEDCKFKEQVILEADKEASAKAHRSIYHFPETPYTRERPIKEREGYDRYFIDGKWEYREVLPEIEGETDDAEE